MFVFEHFTYNRVWTMFMKSKLYFFLKDFDYCVCVKELCSAVQGRTMLFCSAVQSRTVWLCSVV